MLPLFCSWAYLYFLYAPLFRSWVVIYSLCSFSFLFRPLLWSWTFFYVFVGISFFLLFSTISHKFRLPLVFLIQCSACHSDSVALSFGAGCVCIHWTPSTCFSSSLWSWTYLFFVGRPFILFVMFLRFLISYVSPECFTFSAGQDSQTQLPALSEVGMDVVSAADGFQNELDLFRKRIRNRARKSGPETVHVLAFFLNL